MYILKSFMVGVGWVKSDFSVSLCPFLKLLDTQTQNGLRAWQFKRVTWKTQSFVKNENSTKKWFRKVHTSVNLVPYYHTLIGGYGTWCTWYGRHKKCCYPRGSVGLDFKGKCYEIKTLNWMKTHSSGFDIVPTNLHLQ